jgi:hypothetical protein
MSVYVASDFPFEQCLEDVSAHKVRFLKVVPAELKLVLWNTFFGANLFLPVGLCRMLCKFGLSKSQERVAFGLALASDVEKGVYREDVLVDVIKHYRTSSAEDYRRTSIENLSEFCKRGLYRKFATVIDFYNVWHPAAL